MLGIEETQRYFDSIEVRSAKATEYAKQNGIDVSIDGTSWWWLRSPGNSPMNTAYVYGIGTLRSSGGSVHAGNVGVRPAIWVSLE